MWDDPDDFACMTQIAILRYFAHDYVKAVKMLRRALELHPAYIPALFTLGEILRFTGREQQAKKYY